MRSLEKKKRNITTILILCSIFCLVLFFNSYFNYTSGIAYNENGTTLGTRFFLSGPDPYYNMRLCQIALQTGHYPFVSTSDPLLNYPLGVLGSARPPFFNMLAVGSANILQTFMSPIDALGWAMLFLPAIYGALLVFPVYGIGKEIFGRKEGLIAAFFVALIPIHIGAGHGSSFSLFDHDSFILLLTAFTIYFLIKSLKEKDIKKGIIYAILSGLCAAGIQLTWSVVQVIFIVITLYIIVQLFIDLLRKQYNLGPYLKVISFMTVGFLVSLPYFFVTSNDLGTLFFYNTIFYTLIISIAVLVLYYILKKLDFPWIISLPLMGGLSSIGLLFLYLVEIGTVPIIGVIKNIADVIYGSGIYGQKVSLTIGEVNVYSLSQTVMSFGPAIYLLALIGFCLYLYRTYKTKLQSWDVLFILVFIINLWFTTKAGRFLNDLVPQVVILSSFVIMIVMNKIDYKSMARRIRSIGGFAGIRKGVKVIHVLGILFIVFVVVMPNVYCALDAAIPQQSKEQYFGKNYSGAWGTSLYEEMYWADACYWLSQQDTEFTPENRPAIISWWDYGFYLASMSEHPTVADNYQDGIPPASNFLTSQSESESIAVLIIRIADGSRTPPISGEISTEVSDLFKRYLPPVNEKVNDTYAITKFPGQEIVSILNNPNSAPSYNQLIAPEWGNTILRTSAPNAMYHDVTSRILNLSDDQIISLYHDMINITGKSIRYVAVEYRDLVSIFGVFPFLADKAVHGYVTSEDDYFRSFYVDKLTGQEYSISDVRNMTQTDFEDKDLQVQTKNKDAYYNSFVFRTFFGVSSEEKEIPNNPIPTYLLKHFKPVYLSPNIIITEYYEGAKITGSLNVDGFPYYGSTIYILDEYRIPHDACNIGINGTFNLVGLPGNNSFIIIKGANVVKEFTDVISISKDDATWKTSNEYNAPLRMDKSSIDFNVTGVNETGLICNITGSTYSDMKTITDLQNQHYQFTDLMPDRYDVSITNRTGNVTYQQSVFLFPDINNFDITIGGTNG